MKEKTVQDIARMDSGEKFSDFFLVKNCEQRTGSTGSNFLNLTLMDVTGSIAGKKWTVDEPDRQLFPKEDGTPILIYGDFEINDYKGVRQLVLSKWRPAAREDKLNMADFVPRAPEESSEMYAFIYERASAISDDDLRKLCLHFLDKYKKELSYYPAAMKNHHSYYGGLLYHMKRMLVMADKVCQVYDLLDPDWLASGVILHDIQKINEIKSNRYGMANEYTKEGKLLGHLVMGVREIGIEAEALAISQEKAVLVEHMIISHHQEPEFGSPVRPAFPEAEVLHHLDNMDAKIFDMERALENTEAGKFSERIWILHNRQLYKREDD